MSMLDPDIYTDPAAMRVRLQAALPRLGFANARIEVLEVMHALRRAPRRDPASEVCRVAVCYAAQLAGATPRRQVLYGKVYPAAVGARVSREAGGSAAWLPDLGMALWVFPGDPGLPQLMSLVDPARLVEHLPHDALDPVCAPRGAQLPPVELLRYRPEERATLRWCWPDGRSLYAKTFANDAGAALHERFLHFASGGAEGFEVAMPLGYDAATRTFWQRGLATQPVAALIDAANCEALMDCAARGLAQLHAADLPVDTTRSSATLAAACSRRAQKIARCMPELAAPALQVAAAVAAGAPRYAQFRPTLIHGDFHLEQLHLRAGRLVLFDFDEFARGDPLEDLASFIVKWPLADAQLAGRARTAMATAYARRRPELFEPERLDWHLAVQWLHKASRAYVWQRPGWRSDSAAMLVQAQRCAARLGRNKEAA